VFPLFRSRNRIVGKGDVFYLAKIVVISGNTGYAPLIGSKEIPDRVSYGSIEKGSSDPRSDAKSDANYVRPEANRKLDGVKRYLKGWMTRQSFLADQNQHVWKPT